MSQDEKELVKAAFKEAAKEFLEEKYAAFGKFILLKFMLPGLVIALFSVYLKYGR